MPASDAGSDLLDSKIPGAYPDVSRLAVSTHQTLSQALYTRRAEYTKPRNVRIKIGSWNVAAQKGTEKDVAGWFIQGNGVDESIGGYGVKGPKSENNEPREDADQQEARSSKHASTIPKNNDGAVPGEAEVGIYALGLQEIVDISSPTEALRPYTDPTVANRYKNALQEALPEGYQLVAEQQLIGLLLLIYASPTVYPHVKSVSTTSVGTGLMGYMGNKGAVTTRIVLGETTRLVFINSHLAAGADKAALERRNWDASQISSRTRFDPIVDVMGAQQGIGEGLGEEDFAFWFGDLNYRLEGMPGDDIRRLLTIHTKNLDPETLVDSQDLSAASSETSDISTPPSSDFSIQKDSTLDAVPLPPELDPASIQTTITSLLPHDELKQQQKAGKAFHDGWTEGPIQFLPSYKYDFGKVGVFDSSEKKRCPSWCDRILYRTRAAKLRHDAKAKEQEEARKKDEEMKAKGMEHAGEDEEVLFDYNPDTDGETYDEYDENGDPEPETVIAEDGFEDEILLEYYASHMRVLSSDHKPLDAVFALKYDAVIPELKATIHHEVARELDRAENEGRPSVTLVVDRSTGNDSAEDKGKHDNDFGEVDFGDVHYAESKRRNITIANTGRVPATFSFADRPVEEGKPEGPFPPWLSVQFDREPDKGAPGNDQKQYTLEPADVCNVEFKVKIELIELVRNLNESTSALEDILVLRIENGRDHFLPIRGRWLQSAFSRSIDKLVRIPEGGVRKLQHQKPADDQGVKWSAPRELFRLTEAIEDLTERTLADWDMTGHEGDKAPWQHNAGWPFAKDTRYFADDAHETTLANVYEALDCDTSFDSAFDHGTSPMQRLEILAEALLQFLRSLQDGIVIEEIWEQLDSGIAAREKSKQQLSVDEERLWVLEILSSTPNHNVSFVLLTSMLQRIANETANASKPDPKTPRSSVDLPASPQVSVRRRTLSKVPGVAIRQLINRNYATIFADAMFRARDVERMKEKDKVTRKERMIRVMELFLSEGDEGQKL
ncbi:DNase I-like protein [Zopfia rhizophila CBS 207.26]|uniref:DNase I-like protein n=1 Tax=Zopfia rhizophila CBS 207.26 TaxID=1314779 RepID=A0A6A6DQS1_9PEZI|nr:DNase I-like protein [Zopfia rhizophila CBS 207.26]